MKQPTFRRFLHTKEIRVRPGAGKKKDQMERRTWNLMRGRPPSLL